MTGHWLHHTSLVYHDTMSIWHSTFDYSRRQLERIAIRRNARGAGHWWVSDKI